MNRIFGFSKMDLKERLAFHGLDIGFSWTWIKSGLDGCGFFSRTDLIGSSRFGLRFFKEH
jgi:hypothetical protein